MKATLTLTVTTPLEVAVAAADVVSVRAEDASGGFGLWPGHADLLTMLGSSVLRWRRDGAPWRFCALRGGVLRVSGGNTVEVACREAVLGDDLATLEAMVRRRQQDQQDDVRRFRGEQARLHATAIRRLMKGLGDDIEGSTDALARSFR